MEGCAIKGLTACVLPAEGAFVAARHYRKGSALGVVPALRGDGGIRSTAKGPVESSGKNGVATVCMGMFASYAAPFSQGLVATMARPALHSAVRSIGKTCVANQRKAREAGYVSAHCGKLLATGPERMHEKKDVTKIGCTLTLFIAQNTVEDKMPVKKDTAKNF